MATKTGQQKTEPTARKSGKLFGYARVSTTDQDLALQREALEGIGVNTIFEEKASGARRDGRTELQKVLSVLGEGDALVVTRLDRLGRSIRDLANIAHEIEQAGAHLKVIEQSVDTSTAAGRAFYGMLAVFAAFETDVRRERQLEGIAMAKRQGVYTGGKPRLGKDRVKEVDQPRPGACSHCPRVGNGSEFSLSAARRGEQQAFKAGTYPAASSSMS
jgi:DNA invertase Pin-like site-specific DNA recombinase